MAQQSVSIIGAGIGGLTLGRCLSIRGIPTMIYEKMPSTQRYSYAITLHSSAYRPLLKVLGLDELAFKRRVAVDGSSGGDGLINSDESAKQSATGQASFRAHRGKFEELLREGLDIQWETDLDKVEDAPDGKPILCLRNGQRVKTNVVIGIDGVHSNTRKSMSPDTELKVLPFVAFNGKRRVQRKLFDTVYAPLMKGANVIELKQKNTLLNISVNENNPDLVSISWTYSRPSRGASDPLYKPNRPNSGAKDIPEEFYDEIGALRNLEQPFKEVFDQEKLRSERVLFWLMRTTLVSLPDLQDLGRKGVFFIGDSVHAEPIVGGHGANTAITDGVELSEYMFKHGSTDLSKWCERQYPRWKKGVENSERAIAEVHADVPS